MTLSRNLWMVAILLWGISLSNASETGYRQVSISSTSLNTSLQRNLPYKKNTDFGTFVVHQAKILGDAGKNRVLVATRFTYYNPLFEKGINGSASMASGIRYDTAHGKLYLSQTTIEKMQLDNRALSGYMTNDIRSILDTVIAKVLVQKPIYDLQKSGIKGESIKKIAIENGNIVVGMRI